MPQLEHHIQTGEMGLPHMSVTQLCLVGGPQNANAAVAEMEQLLQQIGESEWQYSWLPTGAVHALVHWLSATILRPGGKFAQAIPYFSQAQQAIDQELRRHSIGTQVAVSLHVVFVGPRD